MNKDQFSLDLASLEASRRKLEEELWKAQLACWPDSVRCTVIDVLNWSEDDAEDHFEIAEHLKRWYARSIRMETKSVRVEITNMEIQRWKAERSGRVTRSAVFAMQYDVGVFYTCGGGRYRGFRFGLEPHEYLSGFGKS